MIARADLLLVVTAVLVSAFFSPSMFSALAQTSTEIGKEVREFRGIIVPARTAEISPRYNGLLSKIYFRHHRHSGEKQEGQQHPT